MLINSFSVFDIHSKELSSTEACATEDRMRHLPLLLLLPLLLCCGPDHDSLAGNYHSRQESDDQGPAVMLELQDDGNGSWTVSGGAAVAFTWSQEHGKVVLRTKNGGLVAGELEGDAIMLGLPGMRRLTFLPTRN